jgi:hypothetical protein
MPSVHLPIFKCVNDDDNAVTAVYFTKKITYLTSCGKCLTHWHEEVEEETLLLTMCLQNSDNYNADF